MKYKAGDRVKIKNLDWYDQNKDNNGCVFAENAIVFSRPMVYYCGQILTIEGVDYTGGFYKINEYWWTDEMIEGLANEKRDYILYTEKDWDKEQEIQIVDGFEFQDEYGNTINARKLKVVKKKPKYPTTYEEGCNIVGFDKFKNLMYHSYEPYTMANHMNEYETSIENKLNIFGKLLICRDAYWKIAGEEMGLGKPWEPDWKNDEQFKYIIICRRGCIIKDTYTAKDVILSFPTAEMRNTFYEYFKDLIESCKELL